MNDTQQNQEETAVAVSGSRPREIRTFGDLTEAEQERAVDHAYIELLTAVSEGALRFNDAANGDNLQAAIDAACAEAERMQTPWFASEYIAEAVHKWDPGDGDEMSETVADHLRGIARCTAEDTLYANPDTRVIHLPAP